MMHHITSGVLRKSRNLFCFVTFLRKWDSCLWYFNCIVIKVIQTMHGFAAFQFLNWLTSTDPKPRKSNTPFFRKLSFNICQNLYQNWKSVFLMKWLVMSSETNMSSKWIKEFFQLLIVYDSPRVRRILSYENSVERKWHTWSSLCFYVLSQSLYYIFPRQRAFSITQKLDKNIFTLSWLMLSPVTPGKAWNSGERPQTLVKASSSFSLGLLHRLGWPIW